MHACTTNVVIREAITAQPCMWRKEVDGGISKDIKEGEGKTHREKTSVAFPIKRKGVCIM